TYSCGSGTGTAPTTNINATYGSAFTPALTTCAKTGYHFAGWMISGTNDIKPAGTAFIWEYTNDKTFTAQYEINTINLSWFDGAQQLTVSSDAESCTYDQHMILPTPLTKAGYQFTGWRLIPGH
ncbi:MAG: InlB B-repeat-containing protein, partial [Alphaproteobacteria bacterium]|nr:InlB B-repeat-containing protein [Alphaproteobacteria bacterium]